MELGAEAYREEMLTQDKWKVNKYSCYIEWMEETIKIHKKYKLTKNLFMEIIDGITYMPGAKEVFEAINSQGIPTCLISGGFKYQADKAVVDFKIKHSFAACEYFWKRDGYLEHWNLLPADEKGKVHFMNLLIEEYKLSADDCAFVGDGENDIHIAESVGLSIAFNGHQNLQACCTYSVNQQEGKENLLEILEYLF
jgi:phosphoserine phosphatase